ncbi:MAG: NAD(P)-dependent oxidoreductase, partial [Clostridiaceae bacterium]
MKIVILDGQKLNPGDLSWNKVAKLGDLKLYDITKNNTDAIAERIKDADIVLISKSPINRETILRSPKLKYIGILATGYNMVDLAAAKERGITVTNIPAYGTKAVSQMAIALLLEMCHHVWNHSENVKKGCWTDNIDISFRANPLMELDGKTLGIIGYGRIGQRTAKIAQAMGMNILAYYSNKTGTEDSEIIKFVDLDELLKKSDVISLHCPLFDSTRGMINKDT